MKKQPESGKGSATTEALHPLHEINDVLMELLVRTRFTRYLARRIVGLGEEQAWKEIAVFCVRRGHYDLVLECFGHCMKFHRQLLARIRNGPKRTRTG